MLNTDHAITHRGVAHMTPSPMTPAKCHCCMLRVTGGHFGCHCECENPPPKKGGKL